MCVPARSRALAKGEEITYDYQSDDLNGLVERPVTRAVFTRLLGGAAGGSVTSAPVAAPPRQALM